jgi:hypothetical protein
MFRSFLTTVATAINRLDTALGENWREALAHIIFGAFMGGLALLLILLYSGVPIFGS